ncbi:uncharacterized protein AB9X84_018329 isoform 1-T1 [Acanthopagrus schlegelii]
MNLYRSFGNLMEAWVAEGGHSPDSEWLGNNDEDPSTPSSDTGTNLRSESVDSGVETASSDTSFLAASFSTSTDRAEIDTFMPEGGGLTPASASQSPVLSSPPPSSSALHQKVEQALQRTDSKHLKENPEPLTVEAVLRRRPRASFQPRRHTLDLVRGQRPESFGLWTTLNPAEPMRLTRRRPASMICDRQPVRKRLEDLGEEEVKGLSPGLSYLEQVCQMLEEVARQQMHNQALQMDANAPREHQDVEVSQACQSDSKAAEEDLSSCQSLERAQQTSSEPQQRKGNRLGHFRQRSTSDTSLATLRLRQLNTDCRGQQLSTNDLLEKIEEDHEKQESKKEENHKTYKNWLYKIGSLRRDESAAKDLKSQQMQPCEKNSARRRLSQLFRRSRRKTLAV